MSWEKVMEEYCFSFVPADEDDLIYGDGHVAELVIKHYPDARWAALTAFVKAECDLVFPGDRYTPEGGHSRHCHYIDLNSSLIAVYTSHRVTQLRKQHPSISKEELWQMAVTEIETEFRADPGDPDDPSWKKDDHLKGILLECLRDNVESAFAKVEV